MKGATSFEPYDLDQVRQVSPDWWSSDWPRRPMTCGAQCSQTVENVAARREPSGPRAFFHAMPGGLRRTAIRIDFFHGLQKRFHWIYRRQ